MENAEHKMEKRALVTGAVAVAAAASMAVGGLFDSPKDLLEGEAAPAAVIAESLNVDADAEGDGDAETDEGVTEEKKRGGLRSTLRANILRLPLAVRLLLVLPVWGLGSLFLMGGGALFAVLSPVAGKVLEALFTVAVVLGGFLLGVKAVFPDLPIGKLLNRKTLPGLLVAASILVGLDLVLTAVWADYGTWKNVVQSASLLAVVDGAVIAFARREKKRRARAAEKREARESGRLIATDEAGTFEIPLKWPVKS